MEWNARPVTELASGLFSVVVDARTEFASQWAVFIRPAAQRVLVLNKLNERLPVYTKGHPVSGLVAQNVWVVTDAQVAAGALSLAQQNNVLSFTDGPAVGGLKMFMAPGPLVISDWTLTLADGSAPVNRLWLLIRYVMK
ncbi:hypothetical protein PV08_02521 [Exophiala spinifera]|uniref:Uncharacterized protein n=1 Tax=Exophiala spinifera TaxID=91928 RepID=A0A0D2BGV1_9EURO|nr:uncharacterized protein PV08_02521 [Exophiala spinifera]KIW18233.1 hypothetical protein PV08_02521 [Exophiala spinifera]